MQVGDWVELDLDAPRIDYNSEGIAPGGAKGLKQGKTYKVIEIRDEWEECAPAVQLKGLRNTVCASVLRVCQNGVEEDGIEEVSTKRKKQAGQALQKVGGSSSDAALQRTSKPKL